MEMVNFMGMTEGDLKHIRAKGHTDTQLYISQLSTSQFRTEEDSQMSHRRTSKSSCHNTTQQVPMAWKRVTLHKYTALVFPGLLSLWQTAVAGNISWAPTTVRQPHVDGKRSGCFLGWQDPLPTLGNKKNIETRFSRLRFLFKHCQNPVFTVGEKDLGQSSAGSGMLALRNICDTRAKLCQRSLDRNKDTHQNTVKQTHTSSRPHPEKTISTRWLFLFLQRRYEDPQGREGCDEHTSNDISGPVAPWKQTCDPSCHCQL